MTGSEIVNKYISFFEKRGHTKIANSPLVLQNDPTTLFTSSGMQPLVPYLLGESHPEGTRLVNAQNCFRTQDIEEVGDNRHTTFFRMLGNWSLGDYFKKEQLPWFFEFLIDPNEGLGLDPQKIYVTVFAGNDTIPKDTESIEIWKTLFQTVNIHALEGERIFPYDVDKNWWSRSGTPDKMPAGEPGGPDSEVFYDFGPEYKFHEESSWKDKKCHVNCDCGRYMEIGNSVFMQYVKSDDGSFKELPKPNVDFGGGLERLAAAVNDDPDVFATDLYKEVITKIAETLDVSYTDDNQTPLRVIADHLKAAVYLISNNVTPSNKEQGYVLRRILRRAAVKMHLMGSDLSDFSFADICTTIFSIESPLDPQLAKSDKKEIIQTIDDEISRFAKTLERGLKEVEKNLDNINDVAFDLYQSYGFPYEVLEEHVREKGVTLDKARFDEAFKKHKELSKTASTGMFRGGLADHSEKTVMGHTATHLLHQALRDVLGDSVHQTGSNITSERVRFDFNFDRRLTDEEIKKVENIINEKIKEDLPVHFEIIPTSEAKKLGAIGLFEETYGENSKIYFIGKPPYSIEFCGGPHVSSTGVLQSVEIQKQENLGKTQKRLYLVVQDAKEQSHKDTK